MHEEALIGDGHLAVADGPGGIVVVVTEHLAVVFGTGHTWATPVLGIDEVGTFEGSHLVVFNTGIADEQRVEFVALGMCHHEVHISSIHPFSERVRHGLWERSGMRSPRKHHLGTLVGRTLDGIAAKERIGFDEGLVLVLLDSDEVGESLQRVHGGTLHEEDGTTAVLDELLEDLLLIIILARLETGEGTHADDVAVATHHWDGLEEVLALVALHDDATLSLQFPSPLIDIEHDDVHAQIERRLLGGEASAQGVVEEDEHSGLVLAKSLILIAVGLDLESLIKGFAQVANVGYVLENFHCFVGFMGFLASLV